MTTVAINALCYGCGGTRPRSRQLFCALCGPVYRKIQRAAKGQFAQGLRTGAVASVIGRPCEDCGEPAMHSDHRNYLEPLRVAPTCHRCNLRRGPGITRGSIAHYILDAHAGATSHAAVAGTRPAASSSRGARLG
jgi:hypothetical protein